ncbi:MAG: RDD family protein [Candidatus Accumulibacter sp.]|nr:RDD family protein [Accumulibacter sp.]
MARSIDLGVVTVSVLGVGVTMAMTLPISESAGRASLWLVGAMLFGLALLGYEAVALSLFGTTIGKAAFGLRISAEDGGLLELKSAYRRAFWAWASGNACYFFFPAATAFFWWRGYKVLTTTGITSWDDKIGSVVTQAKIGSLRFSLGALLGASLLASILVINGVSRLVTRPLSSKLGSTVGAGDDIRSPAGPFDDLIPNRPPATAATSPAAGNYFDRFDAPQTPNGQPGTPNAHGEIKPPSEFTYLDKADPNRWGPWMAQRSVEEIERVAKEYEPRLNDPRAWTAVLAWQSAHIQNYNQGANTAMFQAVSAVVHDLKENKVISPILHTVVCDTFSRFCDWRSCEWESPR